MSDTDPLFARAREAFLAGLAAFEAGDAAGAERAYLDSLAALPGRPSTLTNLSAVQLVLGRPADALVHADQALAAEADNAEAWLNRGTALLQLHRPAEALGALDRLLALDAQRPVGWLRRAQALGELGRGDEALAALERALALDPRLLPAWAQKAGLLRERGRLEEAAAAYRESLRLGGDPALHSYFLGAVGAGEPPARPPDAYVQALFDGYADDFEQHLLQQLGYRAHHTVVEGLGLRPEAPCASALDLGCGTGLCGTLLRPLARELVGVDLSATMLARARERGVYDELVQAEAVAHLRTAGRHHDAVVAADVFIYVGDLAPVFQALAGVLAPGGRFGFSLERDLQESPGGYRLLPSLRYAHTEAGVRRLAAEHGYAVRSIEAGVLREEQRRPIEGLFVQLERRV